MTIRRWSTIAGWLTLIGSTAWFAKLAVIVWSNGQIIDTGAAAWLLRIGLICLLVGALGFALWLTRQRRSLVRLIAAVVSPVVFLGSFLVLDTLAAAVVGGRGPAYLAAEAGMGVAAAVWLVLGVWLLTRVRRPLEQTALSHA